MDYAFFFHMVIFQGKHNICLTNFLHLLLLFLLLDNYQVVFPTTYTCSYQSDGVCGNTDARKNPQNKVDITWILLLRYYIHLQRINNMSKLLGRF